MDSRYIKYIQDLTVEVNRLKPRAYNIPEHAQLLNGEWVFLLASTAQEALDIVASYGGGYGSMSSSGSIIVPGHWQLQGYGSPAYTNIKYPFPVNPPYPPTANPTGIYLKHFDIDGEELVTKQWRIRFDGVDSAYWVFLNGQFVGFSQGSRNPAEFDISSKGLMEKENELSVVVAQWSYGSYIEDQDQWWLSGIFRDVNVFGYDKRGNIEDYLLDTISIDDDGDFAKVEVDVWATVAQTSIVKLKVDGVGDWSNTIAPSSAYQGSGHKPTVEHTKFKITIPSPKLWSAEDPNLYPITLSLLLDSGKHSVIDEFNANLGVRTSEIKNGLWCINGKPILIKGVNRHDDHSKRGRAVTLDDVWDDLVLMKQHNINAIRCSHYPSHPSLFHWADLLGFYVVDEADLECHGFGEAVLPGAAGAAAASQHNGDNCAAHKSESRSVSNPVFATNAKDFTSDNPDWEKVYLDRMHQLVHRDRNHPCVVMWSLGNEAFFGQNHVAMYNWAISVSNLPIHYEQDQRDGKTTSVVDVFSVMYPGHDFVEAQGKTEDPKPFLLCEYGHAMGNGPGGLDDYQRLFEKYPRCQGGFIWEWADHGLEKYTEDGKHKFYAYGGDFGELVNDSTFVMDGICNSLHEPTPGLVQLKKTFEPVRFEFSVQKEGKGGTGASDPVDISISVENKNKFVGLDGYEVWVQVHAILGPFAENQNSESLLLKESCFDGNNTHTVTIDQPSVVTASLRLRDDMFWAPKSFELAFGQYIHSEQTTRVGRDDSASAVDFCKEEGEKDNSLFRIANCEAGICKYTGRLILRKHGKEVFKTPPRLSFWRAPTDNDRGGVENGIADDWMRYHLRETHSTLESIIYNKNQITVVEWMAPEVVQWGVIVTSVYTFSAIKSSERNKTYLEVTLDMSLEPRGPFPKDIPRIGLDMSITDDLNTTSVKWFGRGPGESYPDSLTACRFGLFHESVSDMYYNYEVPQETGNRSDVSWVTLADDKDQDLLTVTATSSLDSDKFGFSVLPWSAIDLDLAKHPYQLPPKSTYFNINFGQYGLGSASCGPGPLPQYQLKLRRSSYSVKFII